MKLKWKGTIKEALAVRRFCEDQGLESQHWINHLRHKYTNYDDIYETLDNKTSESKLVVYRLKLEVAELVLSKLPDYSDDILEGYKYNLLAGMVVWDKATLNNTSMAQFCEGKNKKEVEAFISKLQKYASTMIR